MDLGEVLFGGWALFLMFGVPIAMVMNALIAGGIAVWLTKRPTKPYLKAAVMLGLLLAIWFVVWAVPSVQTIRDPVAAGWPSRAVAISSAKEGFLPWFMITGLFAVLPQAGALLIEWLARRRTKTDSWWALPLLAVGLTAAGTAIYVAGAILMRGTPD